MFGVQTWRRFAACSRGCAGPCMHEWHPGMHYGPFATCEEALSVASGLIRGRQADNEETLLGGSRGLRERLGEREVRLEAPGRKVACIVELAGVGHPLVNEDQESGSSERTLPPPLETPAFPREEERVPPDAGGWRLSL